jgi:opacity protein-like surface antigen
MAPRLAPLLLAAASLLASAPARAFERQFHAGGGVGVVGLKHGDFSGAAIGAELDLTYGLSDMFNALVEVSYSPHVLSGQIAGAPDEKGNPGPAIDVKLPGIYKSFTSVAGIAYTLDVLRWIPYVGVLAGTSYFSGPLASDVRFDWALALGLDYQATRSLSLGLALRWHDAPSKRNPDTTQFQGWLRAAYTWGY